MVRPFKALQTLMPRMADVLQKLAAAAGPDGL
jgi:hypothetical protein